MDDYSSQTLSLRDGRTLGYAEWGDLNGVPSLHRMTLYDDFF